MKAMKFFFVAVLGVGLAMSSCTNEVVVTDDDNNQGVNGTDFLSMTLEFPDQGASTYAVEPGTTDEQTVTTVDVVFFSGGTVSNIVSLASTDFTTSGTKTTTKAMQIDKNNYDAVVLVNKPSALAIAVGDSKTDFEAAATVAVGTLTVANNFFMTNATGYKQVYSSNFQPTATAAEAAPVPLKVERGVAKITVTADPGSITVPAGASVSDISWAVDMANKEMFWMRKQTLKRGGVTMETELDYTDAGRQYLYAEDPNFTGHTDADTVNFWKLSDAGNASDAVQYVLENTMDSVDQFRNVSTSIMIELVYTPVGFTSAEATDDGYYVYNGTAIKYADMQGFIATPATASGYPGLAELIAAKSITAGVPASSVEYANDGNTLIFYKKGFSYYNVPIRHFEDPIGNMAYGKYGVVRNNVYKLTVNSVSKPGKIAPDRENWEDDANDYISVQFEVTPWYVRTQGIDL